MTAPTPIPTLDRRDVLAVLFPKPDDYLFISGLAGSARDTAGLTGDGANLFAMAGTMGAAVPMGLGLALSAPEARVTVITGDGEMLMNVGVLATVATLAPQNLSIVCIDNGCHGETGGQAGMTAGLTNLATIAAGAGIVSVMTISSAQEIEAAAGFLNDSAAPRFLCCRVIAGPPASFNRDLDLARCRRRFRNAYLGVAE